MATTDAILSARVVIDENQAEASARRVAANMEKHFALGRYTTDFKNFQQSIDAATSRVTAFGLTAGIFFTVKASMLEIVKSSIEVEKGLANINVVLNLSSRNLKVFSEDLFKVAANTGQTFAMAAKAATEFSRQGLGVEETLKRTRDALNLSRLAGIDTAAAVSDLTAAMNSFSDAILDSTQLVSKFVAVDQRFAVSSADLAEAIKRVGSTAQDAGVPIDDLIGVITALQERTARGGAVIGQSLKTIFTKVQNPEVLNQLEVFGIKVRELGTRHLLPTLEILQNVSQEMNRLGASEKFKVENLIGNLYQINQLKSALKDLERTNSTTSKASSISSGASDESLQRSGELNQTLEAQLNRTGLNLKLLFSRIGEGSLSSGLKNSLDFVNSNLEAVNKTGKIKEAESVGERLGSGVLKGLGDILFGPAILPIFNALLRVGGEAFSKIFEALKSFTPIQRQIRSELEAQRLVLESQTNALLSQSGVTNKLVSTNTSRLAVEREILNTIEAQNSAKMGGATKIVSNNSTGQLTRFKSGQAQGSPLLSSIDIVSRGLDVSRDTLSSSVDVASRLNQGDKNRYSSITPLGQFYNPQTQQFNINRSVGARSRSPLASASVETLESLGLVQHLSEIPRLQGPLQAHTPDFFQQQFLSDKTAAREQYIKNLKSQSAQLVMGGSSRRQLQGIDPDALQAINLKRINSLQNRGLGLSIAAPILANVAGELGFSGESRGDRMGRAFSSGVGNVISGAGTGLALGGGPVGAAIGGTLGGLQSLISIFREMSDILPDVNAKLEKVKDSIARADERQSAAFKINEQAEGMRSGRIGNTDSNFRNFSSSVGKFSQDMLAAGTPAADIRKVIDAALSGDPEEIEKVKGLIKSPSLSGKASLGNFTGRLQSFEKSGKSQEDRESLLASLSNLQTPSGSRLDSLLNTTLSEKMLSSVTYRSIDQPRGNRDPLSILKPGNFTGLIDYLAQAVTDPEERDLLTRGIKDNPETAEFLTTWLRNKPRVPYENKLQEFRKTIPPKSSSVELDFELAKLNTLSQSDLGISGFKTGSDMISTLNAGSLSMQKARNQATINESAANRSPLQIAQLQTLLGGGDLEKEFRGSSINLQSSIKQNFLSGVKGLRGVTPANSAQFGKFSSIFDSLEKTARTGSSKDFSDELLKFKMSISSNVSDTKTYQEVLTSLEKTLYEANKDESNLNFARNDAKTAYDISRKSVEEMVTPNSLANQALQNLTDSLTQNITTFEKLRDSGKLAEKAVQDYTLGLENESVRFNALNSKGLLFSDQRASGQLGIDVGDISTGKMSGKDVINASAGGFAAQLKFDVKDLYKELREAGDDLGASLKASFKDAFKSFLDGSKNAGDALRSLGLSFANKLLDIAAQGTTNALFGALQSLGSSAFQSLGGRSKGSYDYAVQGGGSGYAMGGYVTGGSGVRDDVPAMLNEGDFVLKQSSVNKYGVGFLNRLAGGGSAMLNPASPLSNFALSNDSNPQNAIRMGQESADLNALVSYQQAMDAFEAAKKQRRIGALINLGIAAATAGIQIGASSGRTGGNFPGRPSTGAGATARNSSLWGSQGSILSPASGGYITGSGLQRFAGGGSVDNVPALLTGGEYVVNKSSVSRLGVGFMHRLNRGEVPMYNTGGFVGESIPGSTESGGSGLNDSISRLINSNEKLIASREKSGNDGQMSNQSSQPLVGNISINVSVDNAGNAKADIKTEGSKDTASDSVDQGKRLGEIIKSSVLDTIIKETRNGGILEQNFQRRR